MLTQHPGLVRFVPKSDPSAILLGEPVDSAVDVGAALHKGEEVKVKVYSGNSVLSPGSATDRVETIDRVLSPLAQEEIGGSIRCIGLNVSAPRTHLPRAAQHADSFSTVNTPRRCPSPSPKCPPSSCRFSFLPPNLPNPTQH